MHARMQIHMHGHMHRCIHMLMYMQSIPAHIKTWTQACTHAPVISDKPILNPTKIASAIKY